MVSGLPARPDQSVVSPRFVRSAQGNLLLSFHPSTATLTQKQTNPTQVLIKLLNVYQSSSSATRPSEAGTAEGGVSLGKRMKEEEYYLAVWGYGEHGKGEVSVQCRSGRSRSRSKC
jgi:hypothetical protein